MLSAFASVNQSEPSVANVIPIGFESGVGILNSSTWPEVGSMRPIVFPAGVVNQRRPAASVVMYPGSSLGSSSGKNVVSPLAGSRRPIAAGALALFGSGVVNQTAPSPPAAIPYGVGLISGWAGSLSGNWVTSPSVVMRTSWFDENPLVTHIAPSGPAAILLPKPFVCPVSYSPISPVA